VVAVEGDRKNPVNYGRLCIKGFNLPYIMYGDDKVKRLTRPLIRFDTSKKGTMDGFREATWDEALNLIASKFKEFIETHGKDSVAWYGSGQNYTEESYAANKLFKGFIGTANVEANARLCMASAVGGFLKTFGLDEPVGGYIDIDYADTFFLIGANMAECHPMLFRRVVDRKYSDPDRVKVIVADPRRTPTAEFADLHLQFKPGTDVAMVNAMAYVIIEEGLYDNDSLQYVKFSSGFGGEEMTFGEFREFLTDFTPEKVEELTGVRAEDIRLAARWFGRKGHNTTSMWTMGLNQRRAGVEINTQIHNLHLLTGKIGKLGCDSLSLTGQPNACGGIREQGGLTHILPAHRKVANPKHREEIARIWRVPVENIPDKPTYHTVAMFEAVNKGKIKGIWINTTNPAQTLPNASKYWEGLKKAFVVVSDVYPTVTVRYADVVLPSALWVEKEGVFGCTERRSQLVEKCADAPGEAKPDFWQIVEVAKRMGYDLGFETEEEAWEEYRLATKGTDMTLWGATRGKLKKISGGVQWPCPSTDWNNMGSAKRFVTKEFARMMNNGKTIVRYADGYATLYDQFLEEEGSTSPVNYYGKGGRAIIYAHEYLPPAEEPDEEYPFVLNTGRVLEHWHTGTMTMRAKMLRQLQPEAYVEIHPDDARRIGIVNGQQVKLVSRRGELVVKSWVTPRPRRGVVFVPFFDENKLINMLTIDTPESLSKAKEPEYKICAVRVEPL
jgi:nitrate reductase NapA